MLSSCSEARESSKSRRLFQVFRASSNISIEVGSDEDIAILVHSMLADASIRCREKSRCHKLFSYLLCQGCVVVGGLPLLEDVSWAVVMLKVGELSTGLRDSIYTHSEY